MYVLTDKLWAYPGGDMRSSIARQGRTSVAAWLKKKDISRTLSARYYKDGSEILVSRGPNGNPRRLTPRECARLMGYPDDFQIPVSDTRAYKQFGNSVVVPLIRHAACLMKPWIMNRSASEPVQRRQGLLF